MYKKIIFTKSATQNMSQMNGLAREEIKKFLALNGWTLQEDLSNSCNYCLTKDFSAQNTSASNELNKKVLDFSTLNIYRNSDSWGSESNMTTFDTNGTYHISISRPLHNSRVISIYPGENPREWECNNVYSNTSNSSAIQGYNANDTEITKLCTLDPTGYVDSGDRYPVYGLYKSVGYCRDRYWSITKDSYYYSSSSSQYQNSFAGDVRLDDSLTELCLEMFYFIDEDLQEEFYCVFRTNQMFGRKAPTNNNFYQTLMFVKMPGYPIMCTSTIYESANCTPCNNYQTTTFKTYTDDTTGVKYFTNFPRNTYSYFEVPSSHLNDDKKCASGSNMSTSYNVSADWNPRWDAPDTTPDLWLHHVISLWHSLRPTTTSTETIISAVSNIQVDRIHTMKIFGSTTYFYQPYFKTTVDGVEHTTYSIIRFNDNFDSYEFLYDQSCSSETGTSLLVPIQRQHQYKMHRNGPRHCKWYNMFYTTPEKVVNPTKDDVSLTWKCYPSKRRSIQGYVNYINSTYYGYLINPVSKNSKDWANNSSGGIWWCCNSNTPNTKVWYTEDMTSSTTGQPILSDCIVGAELDASGFEGFALDYSEYSADKVETVDL